MMTSIEPEPRQLLGPLLEGDEQATARLHALLAATAAAEGILDVAYRVLDTPVGSLLLTATISPRILAASARPDAVAAQLKEYFSRGRTVFDVPVDLRLAVGFRCQVLDWLPRIPYGTTESYAQVAAAAGSSRAVRAVGTACLANPVPIVVPCHRVVRSDGSYGGYAGGPEAKRALLTLEATG